MDIQIAIIDIHFARKHGVELGLAELGFQRFDGLRQFAFRILVGFQLEQLDQFEIVLRLAFERLPRLNQVFQSLDPPLDCPSVFLILPESILGGQFFQGFPFPPARGEVKDTPLP